MICSHCGHFVTDLSKGCMWLGCTINLMRNQDILAKATNSYGAGEQLNQRDKLKLEMLRNDIKTLMHFYKD